ncbi:MAG: hypothetical protein Q9228_007771, partial [Teloschistes exilis]
MADLVEFVLQVDNRLYARGQERRRERDQKPSDNNSSSTLHKTSHQSRASDNPSSRSSFVRSWPFSKCLPFSTTPSKLHYEHPGYCIRAIKSERSSEVEKGQRSSQLRAATPSPKTLDTLAKAPKPILIYNEDTTKSALHIPLIANEYAMISSKIGDNGNTASVLMDSGAVGTFISVLHPILDTLEPIEYDSPKTLVMFDGRDSAHGEITHYVATTLKFHDSFPAYPVHLDVTKLCGADIVIGGDWMRENRVILNFADQRVELPLGKKVRATKSKSRSSNTTFRPKPNFQQGERFHISYPNNIVIDKPSKWLPIGHPSVPCEELPEICSKLEQIRIQEDEPSTIPPAESSPSPETLTQTTSPQEVPSLDQEVVTSEDETLVDLSDLSSNDDPEVVIEDPAELPDNDL